MRPKKEIQEEIGAARECALLNLKQGEVNEAFVDLGRVEALKWVLED